MPQVSAFPRTIRPPAADRRAEPAGVALSEVFAATGADAGAAGFVLSQLGKGPAPILWIQDRLTRRETGRPYLPGLGSRQSLLLLDLARPADVLIAAEEGLRCKALQAVVAEVWGDPSVLSFTATKRLVLRAEASSVPCWLIRHAASEGLSAARDRWRLATLASAADPEDGRAPGDPRWRVELFRSRNKRPGLWVAQHDRAADRLDLVAAVPDGTLAETGGAAGQRASR